MSVGLPAQNLILQAPPGSGLGVTDLSSSGLLTSPCALGRLLGSLGWALGGCTVHSFLLMGSSSLVPSHPRVYMMLLPGNGAPESLGPAARLSLPQSGAMGLAATWGSRGHRLAAAPLTPGAPARLEGLWQVCIIVEGSGPILPPPPLLFLTGTPIHLSCSHLPGDDCSPENPLRQASLPSPRAEGFYFTVGVLRSGFGQHGDRAEVE